MQLWELTARESIRDLVTRYNSNGDAGRFAHVIELFADDAVMQLPDRVYTGRAEIMTIFTGTQDTVRGSETLAYVRHHVATHQIDIVDATTASGRCYFAVLSPVGLDHWGRYIDRYVCIDGSWKFEHRRVHVDGRSTNSWFAP